MTNFELIVVVLLLIEAFLLLLNYNSGRGSFAKGYISGYSDGVKFCMNEAKKVFSQIEQEKKSQGNQSS